MLDIFGVYCKVKYVVRNKNMFYLSELSYTVYVLSWFYRFGKEIICCDIIVFDFYDLKIFSIYIR